MTDGSTALDPSAPKPGRAAFAFVFVTVVLDMLALGIVVPVLPKLITAFEGGNFASAARVIGVFGFAWAAMQFIFSPVMGALSDRLGRRPVIIISNLGLGADYVVMALAPTVGWLLLGRIISGITAATFSTASAYIADVTPPDQRAGKFGMLGAAFGLGFVIGPALGGVLGDIDLRLPFWVAGAFSLLNGVYGFFVLPESLSRENRAVFHWRTANPLGSLKLLRTHQALLALGAAAFLQRIAHDSLPSIMVIYTDYRFGWSTSAVGVMLAAVGIGSMLVSIFVTGRAVKRFGERRVMILALIAGAIGFFIYGAASNDLVFLAGLPMLSVWGMGNPCIQALMSRRLGPSEQGQLQGALASLGGVAGMFGPVVMTQMFALGLRGFVDLHVPGLPFFLAAALIAAALALAGRAVVRT